MQDHQEVANAGPGATITVNSPYPNARSQTTFSTPLKHANWHALRYQARELRETALATTFNVAYPDLSIRSLAKAIVHLVRLKVVPYVAMMSPHARFIATPFRPHVALRQRTPNSKVTKHV